MNDVTKLAPWEVLHSEPALQTKWFKIRKQHMRMPTGVELDYFVHEGDDSVICVCVNEQGQILVEKQFRVPVQKISVDYPAGKIDNTDTSPEAAIVRELKEEAGLTPVSIRLIGTVDKDPGFSSSRLSVFLVQGVRESESGQEVTESIVTSFVSPAKIIEMIESGEMACAFCVSATFLAFKELELLTLKVT